MTCSIRILRDLELDNQRFEPTFQEGACSCIYCHRVKTPNHITFLPRPEDKNRKRKIVCMDKIEDTRIVNEKVVYS